MPDTCRITKVLEETPSVKTIVFEKEFSFKPGQFVMVWVPGLNEVPMSLSGANQITVKDVGKVTHILHSLKPGDFIGLRGPYGNGFSLNGKRILAVGGGFGTVPLKPLFGNKRIKKFIIGARSKLNLLWIDEIADVAVCTDDGSMGEKAFVTELADRELATGNYDLVISCGPEKMLKALFKVCEKYGVDVEFSLERLMKCGFGVCGHCAMDPIGWMVCKDGPVADSRILRQLTEFGNYKRDMSGRVVPL
ncbi:MAG: dihydroorotate dehydrogenase electron transfer subunit [Candidatus Diapherotrites archaeon]|nr:dihydroorotate dehydrogenase electron transfer subunit [Candidatus Diapherotrites archaeon]